MVHAGPAVSRPHRNPFVETLHCPVYVSARLCAFNRCVHAGAMGIVLALAVYRPAMLLLVAAVAYSYLYNRRGLRLQSGASISRLLWLPDQSWTWRTNDGRRIDGRLLDATVLGRFFVLLRLQADDPNTGVTTVALAADSLPPEVHRRLRARLTLWRPESHAHDPAALLQDHFARLRSLLFRRGE